MSLLTASCGTLSRVFTITSIVGGVVLLQSIFTLGVLAEDRNEDSELIARLAGYRSEVMSGDLHYLQVAVTLDKQKVPVAEAIERLQRIDYADGQRAARDVIEYLQPELLEDSEQQRRALEFAVAPQRLIFEGERQRSFGRRSEHLVSARTHVFRDDANRQVQGYHRGNCPMFFFQLDWFRSLPADEFLRRSGWSNELDGQLIVGAPDTTPEQGTWIAFDVSDGLPRCQQFAFKENGQVFKVSLSTQYAEHPGNITFPMMRADLSIREGFVTSLLMTILERAEFNRDLGDAPFAMSVPQGWAWFDVRAAGRPGGVLEQPVVDVIAYFEKTLSPELPGSPLARTTDVAGGFGLWIPMILVLNGLFLISAGVAVYRSSG